MSVFGVAEGSRLVSLFAARRGRGALRLNATVPRQRLSQDCSLGSTGHVSHLAQRLPNNLLKRVRINFAADPAYGNQCVVYVPEDEDGLSVRSLSRAL